MAKTNSIHPEWTMRIGAVKGSIWKQTRGENPFFTLKLVRSYQDSEGNWVDSSTFTLADACTAAKILECGTQHLIDLSHDE